jgi:hypothetical protein
MNAPALARALSLLFSLALPASALASEAADEELATAKLLAQKMSTQMRAEFSYRLNQVRYLKGYHVDDLTNFAGNESALTGDFASSRQPELTEGHTQKISRPNFEKVHDKGENKPDFNNGAVKAGGQANGSSSARLESASPESLSLSANADSRTGSTGEARAPATIYQAPAASLADAAAETPARGKTAGSASADASDVGHASRESSYANLVKDEKPEFFRTVEEGKRAPASAAPENPLRELEKLSKTQAFARLKKDKSMRELLRERLLARDFGDEPEDLLEQFRQLLSSVDASPEGLNQSGLSLFDVVRRKYLEKSPVIQSHAGGPGKR